MCFPVKRHWMSVTTTLITRSNFKREFTSTLIGRYIIITTCHISRKTVWFQNGHNLYQYLLINLFVYFLAFCRLPPYKLMLIVTDWWFSSNLWVGEPTFDTNGPARPEWQHGFTENFTVWNSTCLCFTK